MQSSLYVCFSRYMYSRVLAEVGKTEISETVNES